MPPDVALIAPYPPSGTRHGGHSGVASYTANLAEGLASAGLQVQVIAPELAGEPATGADGDVGVERAFPLGRRALPTAIRIAREYAAKVVHVQWELFLYGGPTTLMAAVPALLGARRELGTTPLVTTMHQVVAPGTVDRRYTRLHQVAAPAPIARAGIAAVQAAVSRAAAATIVHEEPFRHIVPRATVIPHGIEEVAPVDRGPAREALGVGDEFVVLCFGFLAPYKGVELVLEAARRLPRRSRVDVVVAGGAHPRLRRVGGYSDELRQRYRDVARFTGWVPDEDVARWFAVADVAVFPYVSPFAASGVLALALAHGTPVLLSPALARGAGAPSVVTAPMEPAALAERLADLASDPAGLAELRHWTAVLAAGRRWPTVAKGHARLYEEVSHVDRLARRRLRAG